MGLESIHEVTSGQGETKGAPESSSAAGKYDPDCRANRLDSREWTVEDTYSPDARQGNLSECRDDTSGQIETIGHGESLIPIEQRLERVPRDDNPALQWEGNRGESECVPRDNNAEGRAIAEILAKYGLHGIEYKDALPDFSKCAEASVEIPNMTKDRFSNYLQADTKGAELWNKQCRDGRTDWKPGDLKTWRSDNQYSWHERSDMRTCDLVPSEINQQFRHMGGVAECKQREEASLKGGFDE